MVAVVTGTLLIIAQEPQRSFTVPLTFDRGIFFSALILCGIGCAIVQFLVVGPSNKHAYQSWTCAEKYAEAKTAYDSSRVDRILYKPGLGYSGWRACSQDHAPMIPKGAARLDAVIGNSR